MTMKKTISIYGVLSLLFICNAFCGEIASQFHSPTNDWERISRTSRGFGPHAWEDTGITEIGMERTVCYGTCPAYTVIIKSDGTFRYKGEQNAKRPGEHTGKISEWKLRELLEFIKDADYFALEDQYRNNVTDRPTVFTYIVLNGKKKIISNYANSGPTKLWAIEQLIDKLLLDAEWDNDKQTTP